MSWGGSQQQQDERQRRKLSSATSASEAGLHGWDRCEGANWRFFTGILVVPK